MTERILNKGSLMKMLSCGMGFNPCFKGDRYHSEINSFGHPSHNVSNS
jgi:hypothetical protein